MSNENVFSIQIVRWVAVANLSLFLCACPAKAQNSSANYTVLLASGFLCETGDFTTCPAMVKSANGDSYEMSGAGTLNTQSKSVIAAGTFAHKFSNGTVLETGVWIASELVSFDSYGIVPGALLQQKLALGPAPFGPKRLPMSSGPMPTGGLAVFRIRLLPMSGASKIAVLQVNCALGDVPRERSVEGIRLTFEKGGNEFSEEVGGHVIFLSMRLEVSPPAKAAQQEAAPGLAEPPRN
ncbi:MAG TPA: hypothetical protein VKO18_08000 [Terriglobia bacterium]|nr:hypothetical protein [Terriglobia bacterium]